MLVRSLTDVSRIETVLLNGRKRYELRTARTLASEYQYSHIIPMH